MHDFPICRSHKWNFYRLTATSRLADESVLKNQAVTTWRFMLFNLIGAAIWAPLVTGAGYLFGQSLEWLFADIRRYEEVVLLIIGVALVLGLLRRLRRRP